MAELFRWWYRYAIVRYLWMLLSLTCLCGLTACVSLKADVRSETPQPGSAEIYTNEPTGFYFPAAVDTFNRVRVTVYNSKGDDVGVGYNQSDHQTVVTVFVYPKPARGPDSTFDGHFKRCEAAIFKQHSDVQLITEQPIQIRPQSIRHDGRQAIFQYIQPHGSVRQPVRSEMYLFTRDNYFVMYRVTYPIDPLTEAPPATRFFLEDFAWPGGGKGA